MATIQDGKWHIELDYIDTRYDPSTRQMIVYTGNTLHLIRNEETAASALSAATGIFNSLSNSKEYGLRLRSVSITRILPSGEN